MWTVIDQILAQTRTIATVGFSSMPSKAGYYVPAYMQENGYKIVPVNPKLTKELGETVYPSLLDIPHPVDLVLIFRRSEAVPPFVEQAIQIGAKAVWMQLGISREEAAALAQKAGLAVVMNACILVEHQRWQAA